MSLRSLVGDARRTFLSSVHTHLVPLGGRGPIISFTFDDFPRSALTTGAPILESFGARGTFYVAMSLMNTKNALGEQFSKEDIKNLLGRGHELGSHTFSHVSARKLAVADFKREVEKGEQAIEEVLGGRPSANFAYPYGDVTVATKGQVGAEMKSCRGTCPGINGPDVDLNLMRAVTLYGDIDRLQAMKEWIEKNQQLKGWLIFYSHDVQEHPSPFGCTPRLLRGVCAFAAELGMQVRTVNQVVSELNKSDRQHYQMIQNRTFAQ